MQPPDVADDDLLELLRELIRIPSVNPELDPDGSGEGEVAAFCVRWLKDRDVDAWIEESVPGRPNAVGHVGGGRGPSVVFCAHLDTVGVSGMEIPPFEPRVEGDRVFGRGSYDMKGGVAAAMWAAARLGPELTEGGLPGSVLLALVADEEHASLGARDFARRHRADACILTEPSDGDLITAHKGFVWAEVVARGRAAHGSRWEEGVSAIGRMGRILTALEEHDVGVLRSRSHPLVGPASLHASLIEGGDAPSVYARECRLTVERRTLPGETAEEVLAELRGVIEASGEGAEVRLLLDRPPLEADNDAAVVEAVRVATETVTGEKPRGTGVAYWMDAAIFAQAGIETVNYGPDGEGAHAAVEWVSAGSVARCADVLTEAARLYLRGTAVRDA